MGGSGATAFLKVVLQNFDVLAGPVVSLLYPLWLQNLHLESFRNHLFVLLTRDTAVYASIKAIETKSPIDDQQWLTYWIMYSLITLFELTFAKLIEWIPIWSYAKLIATCWLVIPYFSGAAYVYEHFVRPTFVSAQNQTVNVWYVPRKKDVVSEKDDIITAAEKYIQKNGTGALREFIDKAEHSGTEPRQRYGVFENEFHY